MYKEGFRALLVMTLLAGCIPAGSVPNIKLGSDTPTKPPEGLKIKVGSNDLWATHIDRRFRNGEEFLVADLCTTSPIFDPDQTLFFVGEIESEKQGTWEHPYQTVLSEADKDGRVKTSIPVWWDGKGVVARGQLTKCK